MERSNVSKQRFLIVTLLNVLITVVEIIGGLVSGSLALLSDAFHNLGGLDFDCFRLLCPSHFGAAGKSATYLWLPAS
jgi:Co/Zn/Cd efflux system component